MRRRFYCLLLALIIDLTFGELPMAIHPVVWMGRLIAREEKVAPRKGKLFPGLFGLGMVLFNLTFLGTAGFLLERLIRRLPWAAGMILESIALSTTFSVRMLSQEAGRVGKAVEEERLEDARLALRSLVSRETKELSAEQIIAAAVESIGENAADSFTAPVLAYLGGGLGLAGAYRLINTMDAMIGYRGDYEWLGKAAARTDDLANLLPARLTALLFIMLSPLVQGNPGETWRITWRDHQKTASPNAGWPMSATAGALKVELTKIGHYTLGDPTIKLNPKTIRKANVLLSGLVVALVGGIGVWLLLAAPPEKKGDVGHPTPR